MAKKFEIYDDHPREVVKHLQGRESISQFSSTVFYLAPNKSPKVCTIIQYEGNGYWTAPREVSYREWTLEEFQNESDLYYDYSGNEALGIQRTKVADFYYLDPKKGVSVITIDEKFTIPQWDDIHLVISGGWDGTAKVSGMDNWPENEIYEFDLSVTNEVTKFFKGTKAELLAHEFDLSDVVLPPEGEFIWFNSSIESASVRAYFDWSFWDDEAPTFPFDVPLNYEVGGVQSMVRFYKPPVTVGGDQ